MLATQLKHHISVPHILDQHCCEPAGTPPGPYCLGIETGELVYIEAKVGDEEEDGSPGKHALRLTCRTLRQAVDGWCTRLEGIVRIKVF